LEPDLLLKDNASLKLGRTTIKVLHTPGHTPGSLCFHIREAKALFSGDTLLKGEFGRIQGPHSMGLMLRSLKRLNSVIPPKTTVYPGHGPSTTMSKEAWLDTLDNLS
jgi:glyoxylase-like metal-dependent hydrolase (beta-lactamase superfamily II)